MTRHQDILGQDKTRQGKDKTRCQVGPPGLFLVVVDDPQLPGRPEQPEREHKGLLTLVRVGIVTG
jgi:hypothetical protein